VSSQIQNFIGEAKINNIYRVNDDTIQFEIVLKRTTEDWRFFANSTFQLTFDTITFPFDNTFLKIQKDTSFLKTGILSGNNNPVRGYEFTETIANNQIILGILGPETIEESDVLKLDDEFVLGKYTLFSTDHRKIPNDLRWKSPTEYYQAAAFKIENDSLYDDARLYTKNDNIDMHNDEGFKLLFSENFLPFIDSCLLVDFYVEYAGQKKMALSWETKYESNVVGYTIKRAFRPSLLTDPSNLDYKVIYTWRNDTTKKYNPEMLSKGNTKYGFFYGLLPDSVEIRGKEYCYQLYCTFYDSTKVPSKQDVFLSQKCAPVPNSIIVSAEIASENPFNDKVAIEFKLADDCLLTIKVYDLNGKEICVIEDNKTNKKIDNVEMKRGIHTVEFDPMPMVASGSYYVYIFGTPVNDNSLEGANVVLKVVNVR
jgi:hypothetical protein